MTTSFTPSTIEKILSEIRPIANAADFGKFVAKRKAEYDEFKKQTRPAWNYENPERFFPVDPESSMLDALLDKICDIAPITLPQESTSYQGEHPWIACIRECADTSACFNNHENPRYVDVHRRFVDVLITCFADLEGNPSEKGVTSFLLVAVTLSRVLGFRRNASPLVICGASDALVDFLMKGNDSNDNSQEFLIRAIFYSSSAGRWISHIAEKNPEDEILYKIHRVIYEGKTAFPTSFFDPEQLRLCFRALHIVKNKGRCNHLGCLLTSVFDNISAVSSSFLNAPLNLHDENGNNIEDTPLSIACCDTRYCDTWTSKVSCSRLIKFGANVNGFVDDSADPTKKIVSRRDGKTPLMLACVSGEDEAIELFLQNTDVNLSLKDNEGKSAVNYLLRRFDCQKKFLQLLHERDPAVFESHVSIADLDFSVRNGLEASVKFLFSLKNVHFNPTELQALFDFCFEELLAIRPKATIKEDPLKSRCESKKQDEVAEAEEDEERHNADYGFEICCKFCNYSGPIPDGPTYQRLRQPQKARYEPFLNVCIRGLSDKLLESGCKGMAVSFTGRRDRAPPSDHKNEMKQPPARQETSDTESSK